MHTLRKIFASGKDKKLRNKSDQNLSCIVEDHYKLCSFKKIYLGLRGNVS